MNILTISQSPLPAEAVGHSLSRARWTKPADLVTQLAQQVPDLLLWYSSDPNGLDWSVVDLVRERADLAWLPLVLLAPLDRAEERVAALRRGVDAVVVFPCEPEELSALVQGLCVRTAHRRGLRSRVRSLSAGAIWESLSASERQVLDLLARGVQNKHIARQLCLSVRTVECHVSHILAKSGCANRTELTSWLLREGLSNSPMPLGHPASQRRPMLTAAGSVEGRR
jgi:DNA-binding NarL/FixJ family response regulator